MFTWKSTKIALDRNKHEHAYLTLCCVNYAMIWLLNENLNIIHDWIIMRKSSSSIKRTKKKNNEKMLDSLIHFGPTASVICGVILKVASIYWVSASVRWNKIRGVNEAQKKNPPQHKTLSFIVIIFRIAEFDISIHIHWSAHTRCLISWICSECWSFRWEAHQNGENGRNISLFNGWIIIK